MCGIGGIVLREIGSSRKDEAHRLLNALRHRGPDDQDIFVSPRGGAVMVHARLAILDPSKAGRQPMRRNSCHITFNGEIYNFRALRQELIDEGESFSTETDTEILLALYARDGPACLARLRGMFAFAIWDERDRSCFLARDRFGIKPLYYGLSSDGDLVFASELKAMLESGMIKKRLDPAGLESYLATGSVTEPLTMIADVRSLEAGHWLRWRDNKLEDRCYFGIDFEASGTTADEASGQTRTALLDSINHHFVSDVPVGIFLSGGLDSGALVALAKEAGKDLNTFSIGVEDASRDESDAARQRARLFGARHREMLLTRELAAHWVTDFFAALDQPTIDGFNIYCAAKLARDHGFRVMLSGLGGDEIFGGYPSFLRVPQLLRLGRGLRWLPALATSFGERCGLSGRAARLAAYLQGEPTLSRAYQTVRSVFSPLERKKIVSSLLGKTWADRESTFGSELPNISGDCISYLELSCYLRNQLLRDADVMSMAHGLELRVPFVDHEFFNMLRTVPAEIRLAPDKELLRKAVPELPELEARNRKRGFALPFAAWLEGEWSDLKGDLKGAPAVPLDSWSRKWCLIVLSRWLRRHDFPGWEDE
jgi:asparagine synthase (glutamine-hydrolysing)